MAYYNPLHNWVVKNLQTKPLKNHWFWSQIEPGCSKLGPLTGSHTQISLELLASPLVAIFSNHGYAIRREKHTKNGWGFFENTF